MVHISCLSNFNKFRFPFQAHILQRPALKIGGYLLLSFNDLSLGFSTVLSAANSKKASFSPTSWAILNFGLLN